MKLYYCIVCNLVYVFNVFDIKKHGLKEVGDRSCHCGETGTLTELALEDLNG